MSRRCDTWIGAVLERRFTGDRIAAAEAARGYGSGPGIADREGSDAPATAFGFLDMKRRQLLVNAVGCRTGGGVNDLVNTLPRLAARLRDSGWDVRACVSLAAREGLARSGDLSVPLDTPAGTSPVGRLRWELCGLPARVAGERPDVVFQFANFVLRRLPVPQVAVLRSQTFFSRVYAGQARAGIYPRLRYAAGQRLSLRTLRLSDAAFCISRTAWKDIRRHAGGGAASVRVSYLGVEPPRLLGERLFADRERIRGLVPSPWSDRLAVFLRPDQATVLHVSTYYRHKNLGDLLRAVDRLTRAGAALQVVLTAGLADPRGPGDIRDPAEVALGRSLAARGVLLDLGPVPHDVAWELQAFADVFAFPSSVESFGHPLLEAMWSGTPVLASDTAIHREIGGEAAVYHRVGDAEDLARKLAALLADPDERRALAERGPRRAATFSWDRHVEDLASAIERVADRSRRRRVSWKEA